MLTIHDSITWLDPFPDGKNLTQNEDIFRNHFANYNFEYPHSSTTYTRVSRDKINTPASLSSSSLSPSSLSPTSAISTMAYTWTSKDKNETPASLAYMNATSYPLTSMPMAAGVDPMLGYGLLGPKTMAQRDEEEQEFLFPEQSFDMGQYAHSFEQYLDKYWKLFHPSFPVVHRATFEGIDESPMLRAAMIAIGAQYSNDSSARLKSRILHDRCMKLFDKVELLLL